jgi:hypothetical protein
MAKIKIGDKVRIKERSGSPSHETCCLVNSEGIVIKPKWFQGQDEYTQWEEGILDDFQDYIFVHIENAADKEYIGDTFVFHAEDLESI